MFSIEEIKKIIENGEASRVEFKSDREKNIDFAKEIAAFANGSGGYLLAGIEDDGTVSGVSNPSKFEEKIYNVCSDSIRPVVTPELWKYKTDGKDLFCFYISQGFSKPYAILQRGRERYYTRRGTRVQEASRDELVRLFQSSGQIHYEATPVIKGRYAELDFERLSGFFKYNQINRIDIMGWEAERIERFLINKEILVEYQERLCPTVAGALMFGKKTSSLLGRSGFTVTKFAYTERDYNYVDFRLDMPIMNTFSENGEKQESGLIDEVLEKIKSIILEKSSASLKGGTRVVDYPYPEESIREAVVHPVRYNEQ